MITLFPTWNYSTRSISDRKVRTFKASLSQRTLGCPLQCNVSEQSTLPAPCWDWPNLQRVYGAYGRSNGRTRGRDRGLKSIGTTWMGRAEQQRNPNSVFLSASQGCPAGGEAVQVRPLPLEQPYRHQNTHTPRILRRCSQFSDLFQILQKQAPCSWGREAYAFRHFVCADYGNNLYFHFNEKEFATLMMVFTQQVAGDERKLIHKELDAAKTQENCSVK